MTNPSSAQSSSNKTAELKAYNEIVRLGEQIVNGLDPSTNRSPAEPDLLSRWIAHEVADAMKAVEKARSAVARQRAVRHATDLILSLWEHRSAWPNGWPPEPARARIEQLDNRRVEKSAKKTGSPWFDRFLDLFSLWLDEGRLWWKLGLVEKGVEGERSALEALPKAEDEGLDLEILERDIKLHDAAQAWLDENDASSKARAKALIEKAFGQIATQRRELQKEALAAMKSPRSSPGRRSQKRKAG